MKVLLNPFDEAGRLGSERGNWVVAAIESRLFWPTSSQVVSYDGKAFLLMPAKNDVLPAIALRANAYALSAQDARREILRFASALSWREGAKLEIVLWGGGNLPRQMGLRKNASVADYLHSDHLPVAASEGAKAALAFYREGVSLENPFYAFLSLYKAFSISIANGRQRQAWITGKRPALKDAGILKRIEEIEAAGSEIGEYLFLQCRNAVAHADREPFVNPDDTDDHFRLSRDVPVMREFTQLAIEETFGILREATIHRAHLYELDGFRDILGTELVERLRADEPVPDGTTVELPAHFVFFAAKGHEKIVFQDIVLRRAEQIEGGLAADFATDSGGVPRELLR